MQDLSPAEWDGRSYAGNTAHHRAHDAWFLRDLPISASDRVLDLGCGSGDFTRTVADLVPDGHVVGLDASASMIAVAREVAGPNQSFVVARVQDVADAVDARFDLVLSRAVLHWVPEADHPGVLAACREVLRPGGWLRIECGGGDNVAEGMPVWDEVAARFGGPQSPWTFLGASHYLRLVEQAGLSLEGGHCRLVAQRRSFDRDSIVGFLHSQVAPAYEVGVPGERHAELRAALVAEVDRMRHWDGTYDQTFVRLDVLARRPA